MKWTTDRPPLIGVSGSSGKTSTAYLIRAVLERGLGRSVGLITPRRTEIGKNCNFPPQWPFWRKELDSQLRRMYDMQCAAAVAVIPDAVARAGWVEGLRFDAAVFTGGAAEGPRPEQCGLGVCNLDDAHAAARAEQFSAASRRTYAEKREQADLNARNLRLLPDRIEFEAVSGAEIQRMRLPVPGGFELYNALAALSCGQALGFSLREMAETLRAVDGIPGRMELVPVHAEFQVLIDCAATPEQLANLLYASRGLTGGRLLLVFGAPGDRDRALRPELGAAAAENADRSYVTVDDPRTETPEDIVRDIAAGMGGAERELCPDRAEAICRALADARPGDLVLLAGRGDKRTMLCGKNWVPFDERAIVRRCLEERRA